MTFRRSLLPILIAIAGAAPAPAQLPPPGTLVMSIRVKLPDSMKVPVPVGNTIDLQITLMSDGRRLATDIAPGPAMAAAMPMLQGIRIHALYALGGDSLHAGILLPPALAGGAPGYRIDVALTVLDSLRRAGSHLMDSIGKKLVDSISKVIPHPTYRALGTKATVAGIQCEEWETIIAMDTTRTCIIPTPVVLRALQDYIKKASGAQQLMDQLPGLSDAAREAYGGRDMTSIRTVNVKTGLRIELVSYTPGAPDAAAFDLPPNLLPFPGAPGSKPPSGESGIEQR
jgi:hypothetical protein